MTKKQVVAIIQARLGSKRFPRKTLASLHGEPLISHVVKRVQQVPSVTQVVVAVPNTDVELIEVLTKLNVEVVRGPEHDVLMRFWLSALTYQADVIMRVTGDCPVWSPSAGEGVIRAYLNDPTNREFWSNDTLNTGWPDGTDTEVFSRSLLEKARNARSTMSKSDAEHVTPWMKRTVGSRAGIYERVNDKHSDLKLSVDTPDDLKRIARLSERLMSIVDDRYGGQKTHAKRIH